MSFDYDEIAACAKELITDFGQQCTLTKLSAGTFDGVLGGYTGQTTTTHTVNLVIDNYTNNLIDGTNIKQKDKLAYIEADIEPLIDNTLKIGTVVHKIVNVKTISPAGTVCLYEAQVRV